MEWDSGGPDRLVNDELASVVAAMRKVVRESGPLGRALRVRLPSRERVVEMIELLRSAVMPGQEASASPAECSCHLGATLARVASILETETEAAFGSAGDAASPERSARSEARRVTREFMGRMPVIQGLVASDVEAALDGDPALTNPLEALLCYPGVRASMTHRVASALHQLGVPLVPRMLTELAHSETGIDIHPGARIGGHFFIDHGTGVVIGETSVIGARVRIYQGVTLGTKSFPLDDRGRVVKGLPRHPIIEDDVVIYSGAIVLGRITVGRGAVIGANVRVAEDVAPGTVVTSSRKLPPASRDAGVQAGAGGDGGLAVGAGDPS